jgi:hypothetical protein
VDVEARRAIRQAEVGAARTMIERVMDRFGLYPERLARETAYGAAEMLAWLVEDQGIEPHPRLQPHRGEGRARLAGSSELCSCRPGLSLSSTRVNATMAPSHAATSPMTTMKRLISVRRIKS